MFKWNAKECFAFSFVLFLVTLCVVLMLLMIKLKDEKKRLLKRISLKCHFFVVAAAILLL